ncbi:MAG: flagellar hook-length control protein FliK, partial [Acidovorax sp.]
AGGGAADRQGRRDEGRPGARQAAVQAAAPAGQAGGGRGVAERSVDIFV